MLKNTILALTTIITISIFPSFANAVEQADSLNYLLSDQQLSDFCASTGNNTNTKIKISLPNETHIYGSIICSVKPNPDLAVIGQ